MREGKGVPGSGQEGAQVAKVLPAMGNLETRDNFISFHPRYIALDLV